MRALTNDPQIFALTFCKIARRFHDGTKAADGKERGTEFMGYAADKGRSRMEGVLELLRSCCDSRFQGCIGLIALQNDGRECCQQANLGRQQTGRRDNAGKIEQRRKSTLNEKRENQQSFRHPVGRKEWLPRDEVGILRRTDVGPRQSLYWRSIKEVALVRLSLTRSLTLFVIETWDRSTVGASPFATAKDIWQV